jgi:hypothetical protein
MSRATHELSRGAITMGSEKGSKLAGDESRYCVSDGHGTWFANSESFRTDDTSVYLGPEMRLGPRYPYLNVH